eukprot:c24777_g1_i3 orf=62-607(+)
MVEASCLLFVLCKLIDKNVQHQLDMAVKSQQSYNGCQGKVVHPIHDQTIFLSNDHKKKLKEEFGIEPWTFEQHTGEAVFIPAGCPHQVRNLKSCIKVALDFVSPENVQHCLRLTEEFRLLPKDHGAKEDKLEVRKMMLYAVSAANKELRSLVSKSKESGVEFSNIHSQGSEDFERIADDGK